MRDLHNRLKTKHKTLPIQVRSFLGSLQGHVIDHDKDKSPLMFSTSVPSLQHAPGLYPCPAAQQNHSSAHWLQADTKFAEAPSVAGSEEAVLYILPALFTGNYIASRQTLCWMDPHPTFLWGTKKHHQWWCFFPSPTSSTCMVASICSDTNLGGKNKLRIWGHVGKEMRNFRLP